MNVKTRRITLCMLAFMLICLSAAPLALVASNHGHFDMGCCCSFCAVIRDDFASLRSITLALILLVTFGISAALIRRAAGSFAQGYCELLPVERKVRLNN